MRGSGRVFVAGLVLALCAAAVGIAFAAEKEPVSGGLLSLPAASPEAPAAMTAAPPEAPAPTPAPPLEAPATTIAAPLEAPAPAAVPAKETGKGDDTSWGVLLRGGYFGLPDFIADELFVQHPDIAGTSFGLEFRYHGEDGGRGVSSIGLAVDYATAKADGVWQADESDVPESASGQVDMLAFTLTGYWSLFPSWYVHPYVGIGIGVAHATGYYQDQGERKDADYWVPVLHVPVGLAVELGKRFQLAIEGRFIDGIAIGGALQVRF